MSRAPALAAWLSLALIACVQAPAAAAAADPRGVAQTVSRELRVQDRLPSEERAPADDANDSLAGRPGPPDGGNDRAALPAGAAQAFGWIALIFAAGCVLLWLVDALAGRSRGIALGRSSVAEAAAAAAAPGRGRAAQADAERLAAEGRYTEAIHQLLADTLALLRRRAGGELSDALTSREIVRVLALPVAERDALREMVARVERTWFAQRLAAADDYHAVRASYSVFAPPAGARA